MTAPRTNLFKETIQLHAKIFWDIESLFMKYILNRKLLIESCSKINFSMGEYIVRYIQTHCKISKFAIRGISFEQNYLTS